MQHHKVIVIASSLFVLRLIGLQAQETIPASSGNAKGTGGSVSYTIGQVTYQTLSGTSRTIAQGVQQPFEISVVTAVENTEGVTLEYKLYPNPTRGLVTLTIKPFDQNNFKYLLFDIRGVLIQDRKIESDVTEIALDTFTPSMYLLIIIRDNKEVKVFKIVKN